MKKTWSSKWISSSQPRKQRKYRHNAPLHARRKFLSAHISKELRERFGRRAVPVRKGDEVLVMKGEFRGFRGNVDNVELAKSRIYVDGMKRKKVDGSEVAVPIRPSNVMITKLSLDDKRRQAVFERVHRKEKAESPKEKKAEPKKEASKQESKPAKAASPEAPANEEEHVKKAEHNHEKKPAGHLHSAEHSSEKDW